MLDEHEQIARRGLNIVPSLDKGKPPMPPMVKSIIDRAEKLLKLASCHGNYPIHCILTMVAVAQEIEALTAPAKQEQAPAKAEAKKA